MCEDGLFLKLSNYLPPASLIIYPNFTGRKKTYSSSSNSFGIVPLTSPALSLFHDDPYMKFLQAFYTEKSPIPPPTIIPPSSIPKPQEFFPSKEFLSPKKQGRSSSSTSSLPQAFEIGESSRKTSIERHEEQIEEIMNYLRELSLNRIVHIEDKVEGLRKGRIDIEEDENEPELTYPYKEVDPLNPPPPIYESELDNEIEIENPIEHEDETVPVIVYEVGESSTAAIPQEDGDRLLPVFMRRDIDSLFWLNVRSSVEQGATAMEKLVEKLENVEEKAECKKLKKELEEARGFMFKERTNEAIDVPIEDEKSPLSEPQGSPPNVIMPPKSAPMTQTAIRQMIKESVDAAIAAERARQANVRNDASGSRPVKGQDTAPDIRECTFAGFMKCNPTVFRGVEGTVELRRWFKKTESVFEISECAEGKKVKFAAATLKGPALTWWKTKVATIGWETVNQMPWTKMKQLMTAEFCPIEEVQRMEHELWNLKVQRVGVYDVVAYTQRFNELALMCPRMVEPERVKVDAYIWGLSNNIKGEVTSSKPADLNEAVHIAHKLMEQKSQARDERILEGRKQKWEKFQSGNSSEEAGEVRGRAYAIKDTEPQGPNVVTSTFLLNNRYAVFLFDAGSDRSFMDTRFSSMLDIKPIKIRASYEVELADRRVVSTSTILNGCALNLVNHIFEIDLMPIELGMFDVIIGMYWLLKHDAVIVCGEKVVRIPYGSKTLIVEGDKGVFGLKVISCIMARKYVEQCCHLFLAHVTENKSKEKRLEDMPIIHDFPEVFPEELPGLPPLRQVEF
ncbi:putative reverse transcriptase domain-containing protein [Tanacetum coccineum]|uniref:Reverse transcriptase domain-containing protein n=1 Tax=Tanacetum coccineum TaxID=301880 RepID=A0ABQ5CDJ2_9ASTR